MVSRSIIAVSVLALVGIAVAVSVAMQFMEPENRDMSRTHGSVTTGKGSPILGASSAPVTIVEFGDYQCHQCYNWFHNTKPSITRDYIDTELANLIFVDMAFLGRDSIPAAQATYCAEDQGAYWQYHDTLYESQESQIDNGWASAERLLAFAFGMGLDMEQFEGCLDSGKHAKRVQHNIGQAREEGVNGTPTFVIVGPDGQQEKIVGAQPYSVFKQVIDSML